MVLLTLSVVLSIDFYLSFFFISACLGFNLLFLLVPKVEA
jgi:hypothetical protein